MGETTGISWTDSTANFWMGCSKVSEACRFCYAERDMTRYGKDFGTLTKAKGIWTDILNPVKYRPGSKVFTCSWSDFFHPGADQWRDEAWEAIRKRPDLIWQILTKRPERILDHLPADWGNGWPNVWLGVTAENQQRADERIHLLLAVPAAVHFVSCEPLLGPINLIEIKLPERYNVGEVHPACINALTTMDDDHFYNRHAALDWVITGGESGPNARPSHPDWFRSLRDQCQAAGVPYHFKAWGEWAPCYGEPELSPRFRGVKYDFTDEMTSIAWLERVGVQHSGRLLDGKVWDEMPDTRR